MGPDAKIFRELASVASQLRWTVTGLLWGGISYRYVASQESKGTRNDLCQSQPDEVVLTRGLSDIQQDLGECRRCRLHSGRTHIVFGEGAASPRLVFVGEGPGFDEDRQGRPFVGRAGKLLDKIIIALGFRRDQVYICNVVKCRPPNNRTPDADEISACSSYLVQQLEILRPSAICALGACAAQTLTGTTSSISQLRGKVHKWRGTPLVCTYHPAYLLRTPSQKAATWQDLLRIQRILFGGQEGE